MTGEALISIILIGLLIEKIAAEKRFKKEFKEMIHENYTNEINDLILKYKKTGWSTKDVSDKWHTFGELYYHRMILFLTIQKAYPKRSWKAKQHYDGTMFDDSFIVGINTDEGQYSYHYDLKYWELFKDIKELDRAPEFDGHTPKDITRLLSLMNEQQEG